MRPVAGLLALAAVAIDGECARAAGDVPQPANEGDIVVTAQLRPQRLSDTPLAISVRDGATLDQLHIHTLEDLAGSLPGISFRSAASNKDVTLFIRGIGTATTSSGAEPSVATVVDGVLLLRPGQQTLEVADIEQTEVLKGPQGTLFGKNASAGVIKITTASPTLHWTATALADFTSDGEQRLKVGIGGPINDSTSFRLTALAAQFDGNARQLTSGDAVNGYRRAGVRGKLKIEPSAALSIVVSADYARQRTDTPYAIYTADQRVAFGSHLITSNPALDAALAAEGITASRDNRNARGTPARIDDTNGGVSLQADVTLPIGVLTSISAARWWKNHQLFDLDGFDALHPGVPGMADDGRLRFSQISQELRLASTPDKSLEYVAGLYFVRGRTHETYSRRVMQLATSGPPLVGSGNADWAIGSYHYSAFGEATSHVTPAFRAVLGGRLIHDDLDYRHERALTTTAALPGVFPPHQSQGRNARNGYSLHAGLQYSLTERLMAYASFTRGYKGPAFNVFFNMRTFDEQPLAPETSRSYEIGLKGSAFGRRLSFSLDGFLTQYAGFQATFADVYLGTPITRLVNAGSVSTRGAEAEVTFAPTRDLSLVLTASRIDAHIDHFVCPIAATQCSAHSIDGQPLPYAPKWQLFTSFDYSRPISRALTGSISAAYSYTSAMEYQLDESPDTIEPAHGRLDASIGIATQDKAYEVRLFVRNLTNTHYSSYLLGNSIGGGLLRIIPRDDRRYFGVTLLARR